MKFKFDYDQKALEIIRRNSNYCDAYMELMDSGLSAIEADGVWVRFQNQCGEDIND